MVNEPVPTTFAVTLPDIDPNMPLAITAECAGPPRVRPVSASETRISALLAPVPSSTAPNTMKISTIWMTIPRGMPNTP